MSSITFFKPTPKNTGSAGSFSCRLNPAGGENQCYLNLIKQNGWDQSRRVATFKGGDDIAIKFNAVELGGIARALNNKEDFSTVHKFGETTTSIKMSWYNGKFSLSVSKGGKKFGIGLVPNECYVLSKFIDNAIIKLCEDKRG